MMLKKKALKKIENDIQIFNLPKSDMNRDIYENVYNYFDCIENAEVWLYEIVGGGHDWPGSWGGNMDVNISAEIWKFFNQYDINGKIDNQ